MQILSVNLVLAGHGQPAVSVTSSSQGSCGLFGEAESRSGVKGRRQKEGKGAVCQQSCPAACGLWHVLVFAVTGRDTCVHKHHSLAGHRPRS